MGININGVNVKMPNACSLSINNVEQTYQNAKGGTFVDRIAIKRNIEFSWGALTTNELNEILGAVSSTFVEFDATQLSSINESGVVEDEYIFGTNPENKLYKVSDKSTPVYAMVDGIPRWQGLSLTLAEQ